jgi:hypothetical protein
MVKLILALLTSTAIAAPFLSPFNKRQATCPALPTSAPTTSNAKLPDVFTFVNGSKVATQADYTCRQAEMSKLLQLQEQGDLPGKPSTFSASYSGGTLTINCGDSGKSISFTVKISTPSGGKAPYPAIIAYGGASIPIPNTVATITFNNDDIAAQQNANSHGTGKFFQLYGSSHSAGAILAWAWGVSRIMDALEATTGHNIDVKHVGVTGCSRNGKGAFAAGAFEPRIALTIPQESGSGGAACWRISDSEHSKGKNIQTASEIVGENAWFSPRFNSFSTKTNTLASDHHFLPALVAPRGLFVIENDIDWLGPVATTGCMKVGRLIYKAVNAPDAMGFSLVGGHSHCQFPSAQQADLTKFINKYLLGQDSVSTANVETSSASVSASDWITWTPPSITS